MWYIIGIMCIKKTMHIRCHDTMFAGVSQSGRDSVFLPFGTISWGDVPIRLAGNILKRSGVSWRRIAVWYRKTGESNPTVLTHGSPLIRQLPRSTGCVFHVETWSPGPESNGRFSLCKGERLTAWLPGLLVQKSTA